MVQEQNNKNPEPTTNQRLKNMNQNPLMKLLKHASTALLFSLGALTLTAHAAETNATQARAQNKSPYTLEQIQAHLREAYRGNIEEGKGLQRWEEPVLRYFIAAFHKALSPIEKDIFHDKFSKYSKITGIKVEGVKSHEWTNVLLVFTEDFISSLQTKTMRKVLFSNPSDEEFNDILNQFKASTQRSYGVLYANKSKKINRAYALFEILEDDREYLNDWAGNLVFRVFVPRSESVSSDIIKPSIFNSIDRKDRQRYFRALRERKITYLQPVDIYLLEVLYSDKVYYGMPIEQAIKVMSNEIYRKLGG